MSSTSFTNGVTLTDAAWFNDVDTASYAALTGVAGTNTITATGPVSQTSYSSGQRFFFKPAATNTGATTLNISSLGAKNVYFNGAALSGGEIQSGVPTLVMYDGTQFQILGPTIGSRLTNSLGADVLLNNTASYFDGPSVAQGTAGVWLAFGTVTLVDTAGAASFDVELWDGTTVIASAQVNTDGLNRQPVVSLQGYLASPAGNIRISAKDVTSTSGKILFNASGNSKDSTVSVIRIA